MDDKILCVSVAGDGISLKGGFSKGNSPHRSLYVEDIYEIIEKLFKIQNPAAELGVLQKSDKQAKLLTFKNDEGKQKNERLKDPW